MDPVPTDHQSNNIPYQLKQKVPEEDEEGQVAEEGVVHTKRAFKPRGTGPAMDDPDADRFDPLLNGGRGGESVCSMSCEIARGWTRRARARANPVP